MPSTIAVGGFFGDEGKGKIISYLALKDNPSIVVRGGAGPNAGHTVKDGNRTYKIRMLPSGFLNKKSKVMIGPGVVINPDVLLKEIKILTFQIEPLLTKTVELSNKTILMRILKEG